MAGVGREWTAGQGGMAGWCMTGHPPADGGAPQAAGKGSACLPPLTSARQPAEAHQPCTQPIPFPPHLAAGPYLAKAALPNLLLYAQLPKVNGPQLTDALVVPPSHALLLHQRAQAAVAAGAQHTRGGGGCRAQAAVGPVRGLAAHGCVVAALVVSKEGDDVNGGALRQLLPIQSQLEAGGVVAHTAGCRRGVGEVEVEEERSSRWAVRAR